MDAQQDKLAWFWWALLWLSLPVYVFLGWFVWSELRYLPAG